MCKIKRVLIQSHDVYLNVYWVGAGSFYLSDQYTEKHVSPKEAGLTIKNGGFAWVRELAETIRNDWDNIEDNARFQYMGDIKDV